MRGWESHPPTPGLSTEKASQKPGRETGKQHGLASPRRPFLDLRWGDLQCQTLRPKPRKKEGFVAEGFNLHLALASGCTLTCVNARMGVTPSNTRAQHRKSFPEAGPRNGETAWPGELLGLAFEKGRRTACFVYIIVDMFMEFCGI